jgi:hypothetical protein
VHPVAVQIGDRCLRCRQSIGDTRVAAEIVDTMRAPFPFRTAGCLAKYIKANPEMSYEAIFVTDHNTGRMLAASDAWFVPTALAAPDGKGTRPDYVAFRSRADAEAFGTHSEPLLRWPQVVAEASAN